jgi:GT2 family glycosyltransferase
MLTSGIIVCTRNRLEEICNLLESIKIQADLPGQIIVVDSSNKKLIECLSFNKRFNKEYFGEGVDLVYKYSDKPGASLQRNIGIELAQTDIVYFFDDDVVLERDYLEEMNKVFLENHEFGGGMGSIANMYPKNNNLHRFIKGLFLLQRDYSTGMFTWSGMPTHTYGISVFKNVEVLGGCCCAYRLNVLRENKFDEWLGAYSYMEDCDLSIRVSKKYKLFFNPGARLQHFHSPNNRDSIMDNMAQYIRNYSYLFFKNFYPENRLKIFAYLWSVIGLFVEAAYIRDKRYIKGYIKGLKDFYSNMPS